MQRRFVAALGPGADRLPLARAVGEGAHGWSRGPLRIAATGPEPHPRCLLAGTVHTLAEVARAAGLDAPDPAGLPEPDPAGEERLLAEAHERLGDGLLDVLRGSFALLLWDPERERLLAARDHMGEAGLVWARAGGAVVLASEVAELLRALPVRPVPDAGAVAHWLAVSGMPADRTLYAGVRRVRAGHVFAAGPGGDGAAHRHWHPRARPEGAGVRAEDAAELVRDAVRTAVSRRVGEPARTAILLSGGLDSSAVAAIASRGVSQERRVTAAYSATFPEHRSVDEAPLIDELLEALGLSGARVVVRGGSVLAGALPYLERWALPPVSPNLFFWMPLLRRVRADGFDVLLDGQGGDELFGLTPYLLADRLRSGRAWTVPELMRRVPGANGRMPRRLTLAWLRDYAVPGALPPAADRLSRRFRGVSPEVPPWLRPDAGRAYAEADPPGAWKRAGHPRWWSDLVLNTCDGMGPALTFDHLRRREAMAGLVSRHPLVDADVVELVLGLDPELAFHPRHSRPLLREAVAGLVPDRVRLRRGKSSFDALFHEGLAGPDLPAIRALLGAPGAHVGAYADLDAVRRELLAGPPGDAAGRQRWALHAWRLSTAELWLRTQAGDEAGLPAAAGAAGHELATH